eukprot:TRINITY_DN602_c0_g1_i4.p1 TRINITY_DN602_c0_g1~~TRINITY_DN602_c0_g1_i4.p1  ORF type:complete len:399 (-),score=106.01 TRINITY_DN602_c0_g1_i4:71-1267(-)
MPSRLFFSPCLYLCLCIVLILGHCLAEETHSLPYLTVRASSHYELGKVVGETFSQRIQEFVSKNDTTLQNVLIPYYKTEKGREVVDLFVKTNMEAFPEYYEEIEGTAEGAQVPLYQLLLMNFAEELEALIHPEEKPQLWEESCSDVLVHQNNGSVLIGHNEDGKKAVKDHAYLLDATIEDGNNDSGTGGPSSSQRYLAYTYPGYLSGMAFGYNDAGMSFSVNAVFPKDVVIGGLGRYWVTRDVLGATSVDDAIARAMVKGSAYGFSLNIGSITEKRAVNVEVSSTECSAYDVQPGDSYVHFNMYERLTVPQKTEESSVHRMRRAKELPQPTNADGIRMILGDTKDNEYPIYRDGAPPDSICTDATAVFDLEHGEMMVYLDNPKNNSPLMRLHMDDIRH